jgi:alkyl hydroperoxide reductase subunit AhpC
VKLHEQLSTLSDFDAEIYAVSHDQPEELLSLSQALEERFDETVTFLSDPQFELIKHMDMYNENGNTAYRGYGIITANGSPVFHTVNDHWGEEFEKSFSEIEEEFSNINERNH